MITPTSINTAASTPVSSQESDFDSDIGHYNVNLYRATNIAVSRNLGLCLNRFDNPAAAVEGFSQFKDKCVTSLKNQESVATIDWENTGDSYHDVEKGYSCPFRKRNPSKFNARDFDSCANRSYKDITDLSRQSKPDAGPQDPEDGVNFHKLELLRPTSGNMIQTWHQLWGLLFPDDEEIPSPTFVPLIEHHDVAFN
ncbi:hypothetical protein CaCOL14_013415 [Colletotrichum acutatum]